MCLFHIGYYQYLSTPLVAFLVGIELVAPHIALELAVADRGIRPLADNHFVLAFDIPDHTADKVRLVVMELEAGSID